MVTIPKLVPPKLHGVIARERLFDTIENAPAPVVWISGPPGSGKSTLAASYIESRRLRCLWYQVDAGDAEAASFFYTMETAVRAHALRKGLPLPKPPVESPVDIDAFAQRYFRVLFDRLPGRTAMVFDNFQEAADSPFDMVMRQAFEQVGEGRRFIVLSLTNPPSTLARLVANRKIALIPPEALRFTAEESNGVAAAYVDLEPAAQQALHEQSGGWAAGLVLMAEHARRTGRVAGTPFADSREVAFAYFASEIFSRATSENQRGLMLMALLPQLTSRLAVAVAGPAAERLLDYLYRHHLFTDRRHGAEVTYEFHALFNAFLRARAVQLLSVDERVAAMVRAAQLLATDGHHEDAMALYVAASDWPMATRLLLRQAPDLYQHARRRTLLYWIAALPPDVVAADPWLDYWTGACQMGAEPMTARRHLERAFDAFARGGDRNGQVMATSAISRACILDASWTGLDRSIAALEVLLDGDTAALPATTLLPALSRLVYAGFARTPRHPRLGAWADRAQAAIERAANGNDAVMAGYSLMSYYHWIGDTAKEQQVMRRVDPMLANPDITPTSHCYWKWADANYVLRNGAPGDALALLNDALALATDYGLPNAAVLRRYRIGYFLTAGDLTGAALELQSLGDLPRVEPYYEMKAWLALLQGDVARARHETETALQLAIERGRTHYVLLDQFLLAIVLAEDGDFDGAVAAIADYRAGTQGVEGGLHQYHALLAEAYVALLRNDRAGCAAALRPALGIGERERYRSHWIWHPRMMAQLYAEALREAFSVDYVREVIRTHRLAPPAPDIETWPWPVRMVTLGGFAVYRNDELLRFEGKTQKRPLALAKALVALGGSHVPARTLIDILWPDSPDDGHKAFEITVHRLRRLLGIDEAVTVTNRHVTLDPAVVWIDARALATELELLVPAARSTETPIIRLETAAPRILALYRGPLLADDGDARWIVPARNRLARQFLRFVLRLGAHWESRACWSQASELYQRGIELDPLAETCYRRQMLCLEAQGQRAEAIEVYRRCRQTLSVVLGVAPVTETDDVYRRLLAG